MSPDLTALVEAVQERTAAYRAQEAAVSATRELLRQQERELSVRGQAMYDARKALIDAVEAPSAE